ncbi:MAG TPA: hypothetical protein PK003_04435 [Bacillota bacterium]|nr:hypothetical protein [Bacillota bacterium]
MSQHTLVTVQELADMLQLSVATIWRYTRTEQILYVQLLNRQYCYDIEKIMDHLADRVWTYEDYLRLPDEERYYYEVFDGMLIREPTPYVHHQQVSGRLFILVHIWL